MKPQGSDGNRHQGKQYLLEALDKGVDKTIIASKLREELAPLVDERQHLLLRLGLKRIW